MERGEQVETEIHLNMRSEVRTPLAASVSSLRYRQVFIVLSWGRNYLVPLLYTLQDYSNVK